MIYWMGWGWGRGIGGGAAHVCHSRPYVSTPPPLSDCIFQHLWQVFLAFFLCRAAPINGSHGFAIAVGDFLPLMLLLVRLLFSLLLQFTYFCTIFNAITTPHIKTEIRKRSEKGKNMKQVMLLELFWVVV